MKENTTTNEMTEQLLASDNHVLLLNPGGNALPLFLVPGAGGLSDSYYELARALGEIPVVGLHMVGTQPGDTPLKSIREMARTNIRWLRQIQPQGPYALLGHSFGANVAFEMALQLEKTGQTVSFVAILDAWAGLKGIRLAGENKIGFVLNLAADYYRDFDIIGEPYPEWVNEIPAIIEQLGMEEVVPAIGMFLKSKLPGKADNIDFVTRLINLRLYNAQMDYMPEQRISGAVLVYKSEVGGEDIDNTMGWAPFSDHLHVIFLPGNHDMLNHDNVTTICNDLKGRWYSPVTGPGQIFH